MEKCKPAWGLPRIAIHTDQTGQLLMGDSIPQTMLVRNQENVFCRSAWNHIFCIFWFHFQKLLNYKSLIPGKGQHYETSTVAWGSQTGFLQQELWHLTQGLAPRQLLPHPSKNTASYLDSWVWSKLRPWSKVQVKVVGRLLLLWLREALEYVRLDVSERQILYLEVSGVSNSIKACLGEFWV